jgi:transposase
MAKFTEKQKLEAVLQYLQGNDSLKKVGKQLGASSSMMRTWVALYEQHGIEGLKSNFTTYTDSFKIEVINYMNETGASIFQTAVRFNIPTSSTLRKWLKIVDEKGIEALQTTKRGRLTMKKEDLKTNKKERSLQELQKEIDYLKMENAYLKKLNALVQKDSRSKNTKKRK